MLLEYLPHKPEGQAKIQIRRGKHHTNAIARGFWQAAVRAVAAHSFELRDDGRYERIYIGAITMLVIGGLIALCEP